MKKKNEAYEKSLLWVPLATFMGAYNNNIPNGFPRASVAMLQKFQGLHPGLFKRGDTWSTAQHRKRLIDWLSTNRTAV